MVLATNQPSPRLPMIWFFGTRTSVKKTSLKKASPVIVTKGRTSMPGVSMEKTR